MPILAIIFLVILGVGALAWFAGRSSGKGSCSHCGHTMPQDHLKHTPMVMPAASPSASPSVPTSTHLQTPPQTPPSPPSPPQM